MLKDKRACFLILAALISLLSYFHYVANELIESPFTDFGHYWTMSTLLRDGYNVWSPNVAPVQSRCLELAKHNNICAFVTPLHSTSFFALMLPFTFLSFAAAILPWFILGHICLFAAIWLIITTCRKKPSLEDICVCVFIIFSFFPIREQTHMMQPNFLILFFLSAALYLMNRGSMLFCGICLGLAVLMREYFALMFLFLVWKRNWRALAGVMLAVVIFKCAGILSFGLPVEIAYWKYISVNFGNTVHLSMHNISFAASVHRFVVEFIGTAASSIITYMGIAIFFLAVFWVTRSKHLDLLLGFSLFLVFCFLVAPWMHESHFIVLYIPIIVSWFRLKSESKPILYWLFIASYLLLGLRYSLVRFLEFNHGLLSIFSVGKLAGLIILFILLCKLLLEEQPEKVSMGIHEH